MPVPGKWRMPARELRTRGPALAAMVDLTDGVLSGARKVERGHQAESATGRGGVFGFGGERVQCGKVGGISQVADGAKRSQAQGNILAGHEPAGDGQHTGVA